MGETGRQAAKAAGAADEATDSEGFVLAARVGYAASGVLHLVIGVLALQMALGDPGQADQKGAISAIASTPGGVVLIWICFLGSVALALFLLSEAVFGARRQPEKDRTKYRVKSAGKAVAYGAIGVAFGGFALTDSSGGGGQTAESLSARLLANPAGAVLLAAVGLGFVAVAVYFVYRGLSRSFEENLKQLPSGKAGTAVVRLGVAGYVAKGVALGVIGVLFGVAAYQHDPQAAAGIDGALRTLQQQPFGAWILGAVALGLICYGIFMVVRAKYQRM
jgi:hypothetical protein